MCVVAADLRGFQLSSRLTLTPGAKPPTRFYIGQPTDTGAHPHCKFTNVSPDCAVKHVVKDSPVVKSS